MECIFLNAVGTTLFVRDDMESGHWLQQEYNITADYPYNPDKVIRDGQRIAFRDPATDNIEVFEINNVRNNAGEGYQQITADHICISELHDEHINKTEITDKTAGQALTTVLTGTLWSLGTNTASGAGNADISRGSVWDAVISIQQAYNVWITPRVVISSAGVITGRYLDIVPAEGVFRGLRLSIRKNLLDPIVTYDDSNVYTALYGYGGNVNKAQTSGDDTTEELTFKDVVWAATSEHPAKPANQTYLEWPEKTALYGRNGRPRYGYYQNGNIKDAATLLEKTWESLKKSCEPLISISGTVVDLYRLGYKDQPIRLHDMAIVEIEETGELLYKLITCNDVDLVNPDGTRPEIGDYIPNIVYINRDTDKKAGGGGGGGRGRGSMTNLEDEEEKAFTQFYNDGQKIGMIVGTKNGIDYINAPQITLAINEWGGTRILLRADTIDIDGLVNELTAYDVTVETITTNNTATFNGEVTCEEGLAVSGDITGFTNLTGDYGTFDSISTDSLTVDENGLIDCGDIDCNDIDCGSIDADGIACLSLKVGGNTSAYSATWQTHTVRYVTLSSQVYFLYASTESTTPTGAAQGQIVKGHTDKVIHFLGSAATDPS